MICKCHKSHDCWGNLEVERDNLFELSYGMTIEEEISKCRELNMKFGDVDRCWYEVWHEPTYINSNLVDVPMIDKNGNSIKYYG